MWVYVFGPFLALLPRRWRESLPFAQSLNWQPVTILSGLTESLFALLGLVYWYSFSVTHWAEDAVIWAMRHGATIEPPYAGFAALALMALHPLTWLLAYFIVEGMVRLCATFTDTTLGILPLFLLDKLMVKALPSADSAIKRPALHVENTFLSYLEAVRERVAVARLPLVPDDIRILPNGEEAVVEIRACRRKPEWIPPQIIRYDGSYYRLEDHALEKAPRPFVYVMRRLTAGVPGRKVLAYP